jgi:hypothetical protein
MAQAGDSSSDSPSGSLRDGSGNDDLKAKMREALDRKKAHDPGVAHPAAAREKAHGHETLEGGPKVHRRKAGGGGA